MAEQITARSAAVAAAFVAAGGLGGFIGSFVNDGRQVREYVPDTQPSDERITNAEAENDIIAAVARAGGAVGTYTLYWRVDGGGYCQARLGTAGPRVDLAQADCVGALVVGSDQVHSRRVRDP